MLTTRKAVDDAVHGVCDVMRRSNAAGVMQYVPELTWLLFLRILDEQQVEEAAHAAAVGQEFTPALEAPYRWRDWGAPKGQKREELDEAGAGKLMAFVNDDLIPHLKGLEKSDDATARQKVISEVLSGVRQTRIDTETNLKDVLDGVHEISPSYIDTQHVFPLSQVYEGLLLRMGDKGSSGGEFFTPREVIRALVKAVDPKIGEDIYDPCCGTGGFLAQAYEYLYEHFEAQGGDATQLDRLKEETFYGREKDNQVFPLALANLALHGIDAPRLWHGNTLTGDAAHDDLYEGAPELFDVILTNPPFGSKEGDHAKAQFAYQTGAAQVLFLQHIIDSLKEGGRCGMVIDEGVLFRTSEKAFVKTKRKLLSECNLYCIVSLPKGVFKQIGTGVKTNLLLFEKGPRTEEIWYYDLTHLNVTKTQPLEQKHFDDFFERLSERSESERSWTVNLAERKKEAKAKADPLRERAQEPAAEAERLSEKLDAMKRQNGSAEDLTASIEDTEVRIKELRKKARDLIRSADKTEDRVYNLKATNPNAEADVDDRTPEELLQVIEEGGREVADAVAALRALSDG